MEAEKLELQAALEEAEGALEQEENKVLRAQLELTQVRQEIERRIGEKDEEFLAVKKNMTKALEGMSGALEQESKGKAEALRMKKKLETWKWLLSTPMPTTWRLKSPSRNTKTKSVKLPPSLRKSKGKRNMLGMPLSMRRGKPMVCKMVLRRPGLFWNKLTVTGG